MYVRCLIFLVIIIFAGITSYGHPILDDPDIVIQVGAFHLEQNALVLKEKLSTLIDKSVIIVPKDGYFKVQLTGFTNPEEIEKLLPALGLLGIKNIWVVPLRYRNEVKPEVVVRTDTSIKTVSVNPELPVTVELIPFISRPFFTLQIGVFHNRSEALRAQKRITTKLSLPVRIVQEWEYYKVIITGFNSMEETFKYYPLLTDMGYPNIIVIETSNK